MEVTNRFKGLDLVDRAPEELWTEVPTCAGCGDQTIPKKKKCKNAKWIPEETLQITEKRREEKAKEKGKDVHNRMQSLREQEGERRKPY